MNKQRSGHGKAGRPSSRQTSDNGDSEGVTGMIAKAGRRLASMVPEALGGRALLRSIDVEFDSLRDLLVKELQDLWSAEHQLLEALPKMAEASSSTALRDAFQSHLKQTQGHVTRLKKAFRSLKIEPGGHTCKAMQGLVGEGNEWMRQSATPGVMDAGLIAAGQRVEHYEMAGYGCVRTFAELLGDNGIAELLQATLDEEGAADKKLTKLAGRINVQAAGGKPSRASAGGSNHRSQTAKRRRTKKRSE